MDFKPNEVIIIINKDSSQTSKKRKTLDKLVRNYKLKAIYVDGPDTDAAVRKALKNPKLKRLVIGGGDGSVRVAASLIGNKRSDVSLGILPVGTANYYIKSLGVHRSLAKAFHVALGKKVEARHLTRANGRDFLLGLNIGYTSHMFTEVTTADKKRFGRVAYIRGIFRVLKKIAPPQIVIEVDGEEKSYTTTELVVLNQSLHFPVPILPQVKGSEPYFEIVTYGLGDGKLAPLFAVVMYALTLGRNQKYLKRIRATKARITTTKPQPVSIDGDSLEQTPLDVELIKKPVEFASA